MNKLAEIYKRNINGVIITLTFHIFIVAILTLTQIKTKEKTFETELIFEIPEEIITPPEELQKKIQQQESTPSNRTNVASNKSIQNKQNTIDLDFQRELEEAQNLLKNVSKQLAKEIPTTNDLQMPEETTEGLDQDSIINKLYNQDSNVEYNLENRYHISLKIPVYLAQKGGTVTMEIIVNRNGLVDNVSLLACNTTDEQVLSFAKTAAITSRFNPSSAAPKKQKGTITYTFIAQN